VADGVWAVTAGAFPSNSYICATAAPGGAILIDAGLDGPAIDRALDELGLAPAHVLCTHGHFDHLGSARYFQQKYGAAVHLHRLDFKTARTNNFLLMAMRLPARIELPDLIAVDDGHRVEIGGRVLTYRHSPGHTPGSCVITLDDNMFTGDTLYSRGVGLSKLPGEVPETLRASIIALWDELPRYTVHPGHGPSAAGSEIRRGNGALRAFLGLSPETAASNHA
jgi:glyoxylase-like metal-dependent hydrolase (beta-lactamase superfamily II)